MLDHQHLLAEYSAIQQALSELAAIYNDAPIGMAVIGADFRFQRINARLAQIKGASIEAHLGRTLRQVVPKLADFGESLVRKIAETGESILNLDIEAETAAEPGVLRSFVEHWSPVTEPEGRVVAVSVVVEEVTARKRAAEALRASEARLREVLDSIKDAFLVMDHEYRIIQMNRDALRIDGRSSSDIIGRTRWQVWPDSVGTPVEAAYRRVMSERVPVMLEHHFMSDKHDVWLDISAYPTTDGIALFYRDVSERRRAEERVRESERRLSTALRAGQLGVFEFNYRPAPTYYWVKSVREIWGVAQNEAVTDELFWASVHPDDLAKVRYATARAAHPRGPRRYDVEYRIFTRDNNALRWVKVAADTLFDGNEPVRMIGTIQDITGRKSSEEQGPAPHARGEPSLEEPARGGAVDRASDGGGTDPKTFAARFAERLAGLASSQDLLVRSQWKGVDLLALITSQLAHYQHLIGVRIHLAGGPAHVSANAAQNLVMALHELATNAAKYGALSGNSGEVAISWSVSAANDEIRIGWMESRGPPVTAPAHKGLGPQIIMRLLERSIGGTVTLRFDPCGLTWSMRAPASAVLEAGTMDYQECPAGGANRSGSMRATIA